MQKPAAVVLLSAIYSFTLAAAGSLPRGVGPEFASFYTGQDEFACIANAAIKLSLSQVNDNSCDCPDGSDEPGTSACAYIDPLSPEQPLPGSVTGTTNTSTALPGFWCANEGHIGTYVPFSYINDGVCDYDLCCDGSDEYKGVGGVKCENRCAGIGKEYRRVQDEKRKSMEKAGKKRKAMIQESADLRRRLEGTIASLKEELATLDAKKDQLRKRHAEAERQEAGKVVQGEGSGGKLGVLVTLAKKRVQELRDTLDKVLDQRDDLADKVEELETILKKFKEEYNPNFNDEGVKAAVKAFEDYSAKEAAGVPVDLSDTDILEVLKEDSESNGVNWKEFEEAPADDTDILYTFEAYLPDFMRKIIQDKLQSLRVWMIQNGMLADNSKPGTESAVVKAAREAAEAAEKEHKDKSKALEKEQAELDKDFGPSDIFRAAKGKCVSVDSGEYTYELCWLDKTHQKSKKGHGNTNMGIFQRIEWGQADEEERLDGRSLGSGRRMVLRYEDGQGCWNGPRRRTDVWLGCAETEELWRVSESEKCVYKMEVGTPAACELEEAVGQPQGKDELTGVVDTGDTPLSHRRLSPTAIMKLPPGILTLPPGSRRLYLVCAHLALGASLWGYNIGILSSVLIHPGWRTALHQPRPSQKGLVTGIYYLGTLLSYLFLSHPLADWLGRRHAALVGTVVLSMGAVVMAATQDGAVGVMVLGRWLCGVGVGVVSTGVPLYQSEISPARERGKFVTMNHVGFITGLAAGLWVGYAMTYWTGPAGEYWGWRVSILLQLLPALIFASGLPFLPESPRWLVENGQTERARAILHSLRDTSYPRAATAAEFRAIASDVSRRRRRSFTSLSLSLVREPALRARLWRAFLLQFMAQMCGATAMKYYLPTLLKALGVEPRVALMAGAAEMTGKIGMTVLEMWLIDRVGRRTCLVGGSVVMGIAMLINGALPLAYPNNANKAADVICIIFIFVYAMGYSLGLGPAAWVYSSEIFPTSVRARGLNFAASGGSIGSILVSQIWPVGIARYGSGIYFFFALVNLICVPVIWFLYPETKGRALEDMDAIFGAPKNDDRAVMLGDGFDEDGVLDGGDGRDDDDESRGEAAEEDAPLLEQ
ncbi:hypothetical protein S7711_01640 [Stachybotrys chartarum IBT 7711]|uniref:Glucosidase 2 subunit beta n=1 Tax=Stachybotrys chartarum (strain CBS 109288 / IBT 7711) TaxID=1280523 RepID=A0A084BCC2_STACB|nr:hypothetical protein S7711_01640 [Stachybotrys chartarum IBT 7711]